MKVRPRNGGTARLIWTSVQDLGAGKVMGKGGAASDCSAMFKEAEDEQYIQDCVLEFLFNQVRGTGGPEKFSQAKYL